MRYLTFRVLLRRIKHIKNYLMDPDASKIKKLLIIFGIIYLLSPIDLIPAPVLGFSIIDDLVLWIFILTHLADELDRYDAEEGLSKESRRRYKGMNIIEGEAVVVDDDDEADAEAEAGGID